jgi:hypothetical protein
LVREYLSNAKRSAVNLDKKTSNQDTTENKSPVHLSSNTIIEVQAIIPGFGHEMSSAQPQEDCIMHNEKEVADELRVFETAQGSADFFASLMVDMKQLESQSDVESSCKLQATVSGPPASTF